MARRPHWWITRLADYSAQNLQDTDTQKPAGRQRDREGDRQVHENETGGRLQHKPTRILLCTNMCLIVITITFRFLGFRV